MRHLLHVDLKTSLPILCSAICPQGGYIAASDSKSLLVFTLSFSADRVNLRRVILPPINTRGIIRLALTASQLITADTTGTITVVDLATKEFTEFATHQSSRSPPPPSCELQLTARLSTELPGAIHALQVSDDGQWLASSDTNNNIHVFNLDVMKVRALGYVLKCS
jgi:U3 small nucleolar RNA-associated protein 4